MSENQNVPRRTKKQVGKHIPRRTKKQVGKHIPRRTKTKVRKDVERRTKKKIKKETKEIRVIGLQTNAMQAKTTGEIYAETIAKNPGQQTVIVLAN